MRPSKYKSIRVVRDYLGLALNKVLLLDSYLSGTRSLITSVTKFATPNTRKLAIFATYDGRQMDESDYRVLIELRKLNYYTCVVCNSNGSRISFPNALSDLLIIRKNLGYDLSAFRDAINYLGFDWDCVLYINDSIYWPNENFLYALTSVENLSENNLVIGLTDSYQRKRHLQSFFLHFSGVQSLIGLKKIVGDIRNWKFKRTAVAYGELQFTETLNTLGIKTLALYDYNELVSDWRISNLGTRDDLEIQKLIKSGVALNPTQHFWNILAAKKGGFVKRSLLNNNPAKLVDLDYPIKFISD